MAWENYQMSCENIRRWNTSSALPMCTEECKKSLNVLGMDPIGRHLTCCRCDNDDRRCVYERRNIGFFCDVDFNNAKECQNDQRRCENGAREEDMTEPRRPEPGQGGEQRERERNPNEECNMDESPESNQFGKKSHQC